MQEELQRCKASSKWYGAPTPRLRPKRARRQPPLGGHAWDHRMQEGRPLRRIHVHCDAYEHSPKSLSLTEIHYRGVHGLADIRRHMRRQDVCHSKDPGPRPTSVLGSRFRPVLYLIRVDAPRTAPHRIVAVQDNDCRSKSRGMQLLLTCWWAIYRHFAYAIAFDLAPSHH